MSRHSLQAEFERAEESRKICMYNLENQKRILDELNIQIAKIQNQLQDNMFSNVLERNRQAAVQNTLKKRVRRLVGLIPELEGELKAAEENLRKIKEKFTS